MKINFTKLVCGLAMALPLFRSPVTRVQDFQAIDLTSYGDSDLNSSGSLTFNLHGNQDIRDFNNPGSDWTTTINGTTSQNVYD